MRVKDFESLKRLLVKLVVVILLIQFVEKALEWNGGMEFLGFGAAIALVIAATTLNLQQGEKKSGSLEDD